MPPKEVAGPAEETIRMWRHGYQQEGLPGEKERISMIFRQNRRVAVLIIIAAAVAGMIIISLPGPLPVIGRVWAPKHTLNYDLDLDQQPEHYVLEKQRLIIYEADQELWRSPGDWQVTLFNIADVTHDDRADLLLVVWKRGSFGQARPFWVTGQDNEFTCHLYIYNLASQRLKPIWMSSALDPPIKGMRIRDTDGDRRNELLITEDYSWHQWFSLPGKSPGSEVTTWQWQDWGFYRLE